MKSMLLCFVLGGYALAGSNLMAQAGPDVGLILPGISVAGLKLGSTPAAFQAVFSQRPGHTNSVYGSDGEGCPDELYYWSDLEFNLSKVDAYFKNGEVSQLSVLGPKFSLANGLKTGATEEQVKQAYPKGRMYVLLHSGSKVNGGRDLHYWVDKGAGVAFKLTWWGSKKKRTVSGIDIFPKGSDFRPEGCISPPQQWDKLK